MKAIVCDFCKETKPATDNHNVDMRHYPYKRIDLFGKCQPVERPIDLQFCSLTCQRAWINKDLDRQADLEEQWRRTTEADEVIEAETAKIEQIARDLAEAHV